MPNIKCGHCHGYHESVDEVRFCAGARPDSTTITNALQEVQVENRGENFFLTEQHQMLYDNHQEEMARQQREVHKDRMRELFQDHPGHGELKSTNQRGGVEFLDVPFSEKDQAKALGARWNPAEKKWYVPVGVDPAKLAPWRILPSNNPALPSTHPTRLTQEGAEARRTQTATKGITEDGMYRLGGTIYKVQWNQTKTALYAKELKVSGEGHDAEVWFDYAPGAIRKLSPSNKMSLEEAKEFGALYGTCCVCGRTLTNEDSIEAGIGPICASKF